MDQYIGKLLDNRYEILERIGTGGMAMVYKALCHRLNRFVAIKILRADLSQDAEFRRRFHDESQAVAMLSHPNIVAVYDVSRSSEFEYIVMELIDGITLKQYMQKRGDKLNWREALHFTTQITKALGHAHGRGIIHRDIKPHNIMVLRDGSVKVADFGIARLMGSHSTLTQEALGSVHYISPEQARGSHIDARSDLYSVGVVLYEMITGRLPFEGDSPVSVAIQHINSIPLSPKEIDGSLPDALESITMKAMTPKAENRYSSADDMLVDLEEFRKNPDINFDYKQNEVVDVSLNIDATQIRGIMTGTGRKRTSSSPEPEDEALQKKGFPWAIVGAVLTILIFVGGLIYFLFSMFFSNLFPAYTDYTVPSLLGQNYELVIADQELIGTFSIISESTVTNDAEAGTILSQIPDAESIVRDPNTQISVTVSGGPVMIEMIDIKNQEYLSVFVLLRDMGLVVEDPTYEYDDEIAANHIISFTPFEGTVLTAGSKIQIVVSKGPEDLKVSVISLIGESESWATSKLDLMNLTLGSVELVYSSTVAEGRVVDQYPQPNTEVTEGTAVNLLVSMGPEPEPDTEPVQKTVSINMPSNNQIVHVQVTMGEKIIYKDEIDTTLTTIATFDVVGSGEQTISIYFDGLLDSTQSIDFTS